MSKLEELIKEFCPNGVEYKRLGDVCIVETGGEPPKNSVKGKHPTGEYIYPIFSNGVGENALWGFSDSYRINIPSVTFSSIGTIGCPTLRETAFTPIIRLKVLYPKNNTELDVKFLKYALETVEFKQQKSSVPNINANMIKSIIIPLPALPVQREIVRILDSFTLYSAELTAELTARRKQYEFYRDKLLNFNHVQYKEVALLELLCQSITDGPHETPVFVDSGIPFISAEAIHDTRIDFSKIRGFISSEYNEQCNKKYKPQTNDVFMVKSGSTTGKVAMVTDSREFNIWSPIAAMRTNTSLLPRYLFYILQTKDIQNQVVKYASNGSQPNLSMRKLEQFKIKVPPMDVQERIVKVLDNFDAICSDLGIGLPAEIEKRQKQYEYYRDKLLTF